MTTARRAALLAWALLLPLSPWAQTVQVVTETTPFVYMQDGKIAGPATEVLEKTLQLAGIKDYRLNVYPWARAYDMAQNEPNVLIYLVARTPEREAKFQWVGEFMQTRYHLYKLRERADIRASNLDAARQFTIGVMRDDLRHQFLQQQGFTRLVMSAQTSENFGQLLKHKVDMVPLSEAGAEAQCRSTAFDCAGLERVLPLDALTTGLYMAYSLGTPPALVQRTQAAFKQLKANGTVQRTMEPKTTVSKAP
ncbi:substrate-binding periplasmic protein [Rhodoferax sp. WC2427]|uniref:substrate-binding periplasmic protein n=1 Tax=Rhodoferax sp. WC2427 TaxID=3234144 RepID=UPI003466D2C4